ncbi:MAG TPA: mitochondrial fission ELM1 family protein, partial [Caulobacteraceae bacterium]|nr:mitochondrial fission ELM1 family protein [Caulobacteraceae bacterium]
MTSIKAWYMTTGEAGFRTQARGLSERVAGEARELVVGLRPFWRRVPAALTPDPLSKLDPSKDRPAPPWPDLLVTCGRRTTALSIAIRRLSAGRTLTVHVQDPLTRAAAFDFIVAMAHDTIAGPNVMKVVTALHDVTPAKLEIARADWGPRLKADARPLVGVLLGGATRREGFTAEKAGPLAEGLAQLRREGGMRIVVTASRRTPPEAMARLRSTFKGDPDVSLWGPEDENPYLGILGLADRLVVTSDSVSMISEALATRAGVEVFGEAGNARHAQFLGDLTRQGLIRSFTGDPSAPPA